MKAQEVQQAALGAANSAIEASRKSLSVQMAQEWAKVASMLVDIAATAERLL